MTLSLAGMVFGVVKMGFLWGLKEHERVKNVEVLEMGDVCRRKKFMEMETESLGH